MNPVGGPTARSLYPLLALLAALAGQTSLQLGSAALGVPLYLTAMVCVILGVRAEETTPQVPQSPLPTRNAASALLVLLLATFFLGRFRIDSVPWGLSNDEGVEGLIAYRFLSGAPIVPFSNIGGVRETFYHVLLIPVFRLFGPGMESLRFLSLLVGLASLLLAYFAARGFFSARVGILSAALLAVSPWHLLTIRAGLRSVLVPAFVLATLGLFQRALAGRCLRFFVAAGMVLGVGMYSHPGFRVIPLVLLAWAPLRRWVLKAPPLAWKEVVAVGAPFVVFVLPQIPYLRGHSPGLLAPWGESLHRAPGASLPLNVVASFLMPAFTFARSADPGGSAYAGVDLVYAAVGRTPETVVSAALMACGFALALARFVRRRSGGEGVLLLAFLATILTAGLGGPSPTRLIGNLALLCLMGALFLETLVAHLGARFGGRVGWAAAGILLAVGAALGYDQYFNRAGNSEKAMSPFSFVHTQMGLYAVRQPPDHPIYVLHTEQTEVLRFLTYPRRQLTFLYTDPASPDLDQIQSATGHVELVMETHRRFLGLLATLGRTFPGAELRFLSHRNFSPDRKVACVLDILPGSRKRPPGEQPTPDPSPGREGGP